MASLFVLSGLVLIFPARARRQTEPFDGSREKRQHKSSVFTVQYKCAFREYWYDDLPEYASFHEAQAVAEAVARNRGSVAIVLDPYGQRVHIADYR